MYFSKKQSSNCNLNRFGLPAHEIERLTQLARSFDAVAAVQLFNTEGTSGSPVADIVSLEQKFPEQGAEDENHEVQEGTGCQERLETNGYESVRGQCSPFANPNDTQPWRPVMVIRPAPSPTPVGRSQVHNLYLTLFLYSYSLLGQAAAGWTFATFPYLGQIQVRT